MLAATSACRAVFGGWRIAAIRQRAANPMGLAV
jgi:hypothetical protein